MRARIAGCALLFGVAGIAHLLVPGPFRAIVPPGFGDPAFDVAASGVAEIAGAVGLLLPATRRLAAAGLICLLLAVWPANWYMALRPDLFAHVAPRAILILRLPLQVVLIALLFPITRKNTDSGERA